MLATKRSCAAAYGPLLQPESSCSLPIPSNTTPLSQKWCATTRHHQSCRSPISQLPRPIPHIYDISRLPIAASRSCKRPVVQVHACLPAVHLNAHHSALKRAEELAAMHYERQRYNTLHTPVAIWCDRHRDRGTSQPATYVKWHCSGRFGHRI